MELNEWILSNIPYEDDDAVLEKQFEDKQKRLKNKWVIGKTNKKKKLNKK